MSTGSASIQPTAPSTSRPTPVFGGSRPAPRQRPGWPIATRTPWDSPCWTPTAFSAQVTPTSRKHAEEGLPPLLGLIESQDAGNTWRSISLLGEADFHVLRSAGDRIYGFDATNVRLMASEDAGRTWEDRSLPGFPPEPLLDLVIDPASSDWLIASTERELYETDDSGRSWTRLAPFPGLLAWQNDTLVLVDAAGGVHTSGDDGRDWARVGEVADSPLRYSPTASARCTSLSTTARSWSLATVASSGRFVRSRSRSSSFA